jgi:hypothetical protein
VLGWTLSDFRQRRDAWGRRGILWIDYADTAAEVGVEDSQGNPKECEIICSILAQVFSPCCYSFEIFLPTLPSPSSHMTCVIGQSHGVLESRTVMVIAFYTRQLALLNAAVAAIGLADCPNLRIVTVDSSQGRCEP